jgi:hypothetical protein
MGGLGRCGSLIRGAYLELIRVSIYTRGLCCYGVLWNCIHGGEDRTGGDGRSGEREWEPREEYGVRSKLTLQQGRVSYS